MNQENAQRFIVVMTIITLGSTVGATLKQPPKAKINPDRIHRYVFGGFAAMFISAVVADFDARLGMTLAALVAGGAFFTYGLPTINSYFEVPTPTGVKGGTQAQNPSSRLQPRLV